MEIKTGNFNLSYLVKFKFKTYNGSPMSDPPEEIRRNISAVTLNIET